MYGKNKTINELLLDEISGGEGKTPPRAVVTRVDDWYSVQIYEECGSTDMAIETIEEVITVLKDHSIDKSNVEWNLGLHPRPAGW